MAIPRHLVAQAQEAAASEIVRAVATRVRAQHFEPDADYAAQRASRIQRLVDSDLAELRRSTGG